MRDPRGWTGKSWLMALMIGGVFHAPPALVAETVRSGDTCTEGCIVLRAGDVVIGYGCILDPDSPTHENGGCKATTSGCNEPDCDEATLALNTREGSSLGLIRLACNDQDGGTVLNSQQVAASRAVGVEE
jgi:hypothetical protein